MAQPHAYGPVLDTGLPPTKNPDPAATMDTKQQRTKSWAAMDANQARMQRPVLDTDEDRALTTDTDQCRVATDTGQGRAPIMDTDRGRVATDMGQDHGLVMDMDQDPTPTLDTGQGRVATDTGQDHAPVMDMDQDAPPTMDTDQGRVATDTGPGRAPVIDMDQGPTPTLDTGQRSVTMDTDLRLVTHAPLGPRSLRQKVMRLRRRDARPCPRRLLVNNNQRAYTLTRS